MRPRSAGRTPGLVWRRCAPERGAIVVQVAVALLVLSAFSMFVVDYGVLWVSRSQAQNAADSGALAAALALALDDDDHADAAPAKQAAQGFALANDIWGEDPRFDLTTDVTFFGDEPAAFPAECGDDSCVRVQVFRNQSHGNPLPTIFGWLVGLTEQGVRATATARTSPGNASDCLKPWAVADRWAENNPVPGADLTEDSTFDPTGPTPDVYVPPSSSETGTSFALAGSLGGELTLKIGQAGDTITPGWFQPLSLGGQAGPSGPITSCVKRVWSVGDVIPLANQADADVLRADVQALIDMDPDARWDGLKVAGSCVGPPYTCSLPGHTHSPRLIALPVFNLVQFLDSGGPGAGTVRVVNILGFFIDHLTGTRIVGYIATKPDLKVADGSDVAASASFIKAVQLVR